MKTFSDVPKMTVRLAPRADDDRGAPASGRTHVRCRKGPANTTFQRQTWKVIAQVTEYRLDGNGLRLVLFDHGSYMQRRDPGAELSSGQSTRAATDIDGAWQTFVSDCGGPSSVAAAGRGRLRAAASASGAAASSPPRRARRTGPSYTP